MIKSFVETINKFTVEFPDSPVVSEFTTRINEDQPTRDENPASHFCVYFASFDPKTKKVFIGHHKKADQWLFNGGHIDKGETPEEALEREMGEEWGIRISLKSIGCPKLLTITSINRENYQCKKHYDIWFFVPLSEKSFKPDQTLLATEFYSTGWKTIEEAKTLVRDPNTLKALFEFEDLFNKNADN